MNNVSYNVNRFKSNIVNEKMRGNCLQNCKNQLQPRILYFIKQNEFQRGQISINFLPMCPFLRKICSSKTRKYNKRETESRTQGIQHKRAELCEIPDDFTQISQEKRHRAGLGEHQSIWEQEDKRLGKSVSKKKMEQMWLSRWKIFLIGM